MLSLNSSSTFTTFWTDLPLDQKDELLRFFKLEEHQVGENINFLSPSDIQEIADRGHSQFIAKGYDSMPKHLRDRHPHPHQESILLQYMFSPDVYFLTIAIAQADFVKHHILSQRIDVGHATETIFQVLFSLCVGIHGDDNTISSQIIQNMIDELNNEQCVPLTDVIDLP